MKAHLVHNLLEARGLPPNKLGAATGTSTRLRDKLGELFRHDFPSLAGALLVLEEHPAC